MTFAVGDRVAVYAGRSRYVGQIISIKRYDGMLEIQGKVLIHYVHPKQCRKLKKKPCWKHLLNAEGVVIWVDPQKKEEGFGRWAFSGPRKGWIEFRKR